MTRITRATVKSFIKKHADNLYIDVRGSFDGMDDAIAFDKGHGFVKAVPSKRNAENTLGIEGAWFVLGGHDHFEAYEDDNGYKGIAVSNCCGYFTLAITA